MSTTTVAGVILVAVLLISLLVVGVMFWWGAREDGRDQQRVDAELRDRRRSDTEDRTT